MKKLIISILIMLIISIIVIVGVIIYIKNKQSYNEEQTLGEFVDAGKIREGIYNVDSIDTFITVEECVNTYYKYIEVNYFINNSSDEPIRIDMSKLVEGINSEEDKKEAILAVLDNQYKTENNINIDSISNFIPETTNNTEYIAKSMKCLEGKDINTYLVEGAIYENVTKKEDKSFIVKLDKNNLCFSIYPFENNNNSEIDISEYTSEINLNKYNTFNYTSISEEDLIKRYFSQFKTEILGNVNEAYNLLDKGYRESKCSTIEEFNELIEKRNIKSGYIKSFKTNKYGDYTQYICIDQFENYYVFNVTSIMDYTVMLDTYTLDLPSFIEKYDQATDQNKAGMNIEKFMTAINEQDYRYAYNCLATSFKQNNFPTLESFKEYASNTFFKNNTTEYKNVSEEGKYYVYELNITDSNDSTNYIEKQFIVNLKDNREFELSFELE